MTEITGPMGECTIHYETDGLEIDVTVRGPIRADELVQRTAMAAYAVVHEHDLSPDEARFVPDVRHAAPYDPDSAITL